MNVKDRQCLLTFLRRQNGESYYTGSVDGICGKLTRQAIQMFQEDFGGLNVTGEADSDTEKALRHAVAYGMPQRKSDRSFWEEITFFTRGEFACKCGGKYCSGYPAEPQETLVRLADRVRKHFGKPAHVVSGLRCRTHNANCGGVEASQHMYGEAVDLRVEGISADTLLAYVQQQPEVRYAYKINGTNVHFDIPKGNR